MPLLSLDIETVIANAIDSSIRETFSLMIGQELTHVQTNRVVNKMPTVGKYNQNRPVDYDEEITVVVGLSGQLQGSVSVCMDLESALLWTENLIDHQSATLDQTVIDAISELGNIVTGGAKRRLEDRDLALGLPYVMLAGKSRLAFPSSCEPLQVEYAFGGHEMNVFISLTTA
ncbi:chemotaxis protein CheX [Rhodopirellula rubra]|uniref:Chemotaxis protein CheX n=1 Tax=Aporhodopirellula rubra TaxID=980271 RepID=A0A7W5DUX4_9BACT|nr:chemotaxis protein CheX [Aporhodopirellula rubra]MBB3204845.1 chemotaxis protein CheX [Aporhodopirellula rubra]